MIESKVAEFVKSQEKNEASICDPKLKRINAQLVLVVLQANLKAVLPSPSLV